MRKEPKFIHQVLLNTHNGEILHTIYGQDREWRKEKKTMLCDLDS